MKDVKLGLSQIEGVWAQGAERMFGPKSDEVRGDWRKLDN
jgi:hypothetical protein